MMQVTIQLPDEIAAALGNAGEIPRQALEALAAEAYRTRKLSRHEVSRLLDFDYWQTEEFLSRHEAQRSFTIADIEIDRQSLSKLEPK